MQSYAYEQGLLPCVANRAKWRENFTTKLDLYLIQIFPVPLFNLH